MNYNLYLLVAGCIALFTACLHLIGGHFHPVRPFLNTSMSKTVKCIFYACWHMVTVSLFASACWYLFSAFNPVSPVSVYILSAQFILFGILFLVVGSYLKLARFYLRLPQWILLIPVGLFGFIGTF